MGTAALAGHCSAQPKIYQLDCLEVRSQHHVSGLNVTVNYWRRIAMKMVQGPEELLRPLQCRVPRRVPTHITLLEETLLLSVELQKILAVDVFKNHPREVAVHTRADEGGEIRVPFQRCADADFSKHIEDLALVDLAIVFHIFNMHDFDGHNLL